MQRALCLSCHTTRCTFNGSIRCSGLLPLAPGVIGVVAVVVAIVAVCAVDGFIDAVAVVRATNNQKPILVISKLAEVGFQGLNLYPLG